MLALQMPSKPSRSQVNSDSQLLALRSVISHELCCRCAAVFGSSSAARSFGGFGIDAVFEFKQHTVADKPWSCVDLLATLVGRDDQLEAIEQGSK